MSYLSSGAVRTRVNTLWPRILWRLHSTLYKVSFSVNVVYVCCYVEHVDLYVASLD